MSGLDRLDFTDAAALRQWFADLRVAIDDANGVTDDLLRPLRQRDLGHVEHRRLFLDAKQKIAALLAYADPPREADSGADAPPQSGPRK